MSNLLNFWGDYIFSTLRILTPQKWRHFEDPKTPLRNTGSFTPPLVRVQPGILRVVKHIKFELFLFNLMVRNGWSEIAILKIDWSWTRKNDLLGGGFKYFLFSPLFEEDFQYFSDGLKPPTSLGINMWASFFSQWPTSCTRGNSLYSCVGCWPDILQSA